MELWVNNKAEILSLSGNKNFGQDGCGRKDGKYFCDYCPSHYRRQACGMQGENMKLTNIFIKYCLKYFVAFIIILACCIPVAEVSYKIDKQQIIEKNQLKLKEGINIIDQNISKMFLLTKSMKQDYHFNMLIKKKGELKTDEYLWLQNARRKMEGDSLIYTFPTYSFLLFKENNIYISPVQSDSDFNEYYGKFLKISGAETAEKLKQKLFEIPGIYSFNKVDKINFIADGMEKELNNAIICMIKGTSDYTDSASYIMTYVLDPKTLIQLLLAEDAMAEGVVQIEDVGQDEILLSYGTDCILPWNNAPDERVQINGEGYFLCSYEAQEAGWRVTIGFPETIVENQTKNIMYIILFYICLGIFIVLCLTIFFSYRQYANIRNLFATLSGEGSAPDKGQNEYEALRCILKNITQNKNEYKSKMENLNQQNRALMLENLIVRGINTQEEREEFKKCFERPLEYFCVVLLRMKIEDLNQYQITLLCIMEYLKETSPNDFSNVHTGIRDELFLFSLNPEDASNVSGIKVMFENIITALSDNSNIVFHVGISAIGTDISNINVCYNQAMQVIQAYCSEDVNSVEAYNININSAKENIIDVEFLNKLYNLILCGEKEMIGQQFSKVEAYYQKMPVQYELQKQQIFYTVRNVIYSAYLHLVTNPGEADILPEYQSNYSLSEMVGKLRDSSIAVCSYMEEKKKSRNSELRQNIINYMESHFMDSSITASSVSREMKISEKYLSQFMKEQTGETFASYLERLRIVKAKQYLEETDLSNEKISELTGFGALNTFYRTFHKHTGVSPKAYRSACQH